MDLKKIEAPKPLSYSPPKWYFGEDNNIDQEIANDILSAIYWRRRKEIEAGGGHFSEADEVGKFKLLAEAVMAASKQAERIKDGAGRAMLRLFWKIQKQGLYYTSDEEYETFEEFLYDRFPHIPPGSGEAYDILFLMREFFPMAEKLGNGWTPEHLLAMRDNWSKTRASIHYMRGITREFNESLRGIDEELKTEKVNISKLEKAGRLEEAEEEKKKLSDIEKNKAVLEEQELRVWKGKMDKALNAIVDPSIPAGNIALLNQRLFDDYEKKVMSGLQAFTQSGTCFYVEVPQGYERTIENSLRGIVQFQSTDLNVIKKEVNQL
jgi:hypothetical protein